jgi:hypothetical protein
MPSRRSSVPGRILLIAVLGGAVLALGVYQGRAIIGSSDIRVRMGSGAAPVRPVPDSTFLRSYPVTFNGTGTQFGHYTSRQKARQVIEEYARRLRAEHAARPAETALPALKSHAAGCSALSYTDAEGRLVGITAFDNPETGGCDYFVGATAAAPSRTRGTGDCPGREPPGVPRPARTIRALCLENLGGVPSVLNFYEAWGPPGHVADDVREQMAEAGWRERRDSSRVLTRNYEGLALLSFSRGHEQCLVGIDRDPRTGKMGILVFWAERRWLPEGVAL